MSLSPHAAGYWACTSSRRQYVSIEEHQEKTGTSLNPDSPHISGLLVETATQPYRSTAKWHCNFWCFKNGCCNDVLFIPFHLSGSLPFEIQWIMDCVKIVLDTLVSPQGTFTTNTEASTLWSFTQGCHEPFSTHIGIPLDTPIFPRFTSDHLGPPKSHNTLDQSI